MSVIQSIVMGKSKGSIGNVTLAVVKGQTIAKQKIVNPTASNTEGQVTSRGCMQNVVLAWQFLSIFLVGMSPLRKSTESTYNVFVRLAKSLFSDIIYSFLNGKVAGAFATGYEAVSKLCADGVSLAGNYITVLSLSAVGDNFVVTFTTQGLLWDSSISIHVMQFGSGNGINEVIVRPITAQEWLNGSASVPSVNGLGSLVAYVTNDSVKKCSNVLFAEV